ncbi:MAG: hypothetical protein MK193_00060 [Lentisphaeria bacterium]|nr:hypothetical protein [Lentisphaeria bacterium]
MNKNRKNDCPSSEDLSAWYDAGQPSGRISVHIATCDKCRHEVESFASIDLELSSFINDGSKMRTQVDITSESIRKIAQEQQQTYKKRASGKRIYLLYVAIFTISVLGAVMHLWRQHNQRMTYQDTKVKIAEKNSLSKEGVKLIAIETSNTNGMQLVQENKEVDLAGITQEWSGKDLNTIKALLISLVETDIRSQEALEAIKQTNSVTYLQVILRLNYGLLNQLQLELQKQGWKFIYSDVSLEQIGQYADYKENDGALVEMRFTVSP